MKKILSLVLSIIMFASVFFAVPITVNSVETEVAEISEKSGYYTYTILSDGTIDIIDYSGSESSLTIPSTIDGYKVTGIECKTFYGCSSLTSVVIPDGVTYLGYEAFRSCNQLKTVTIPDSVTLIGDWVFSNCTSLRSIKIPDSVTWMGDRVFGNCTDLYSITLSNNLTRIGDWFFSGCIDLELISIPSSVTYIGMGAFYECERISSITIPEGVTDINKHAFNCCENLTSVKIPNTVTSMGSFAFRDCVNLKSITIPNSIESIDSGAFSGCSRLSSVSLPTNMTNMGDSVFSGCTTLRSITIPNGVNTIGDYMFDNCQNLTDVTIPISVTSIGDCAFLGCECIETVYYQGSSSQKSSIQAEYGNNCLFSATWHYALCNDNQPHTYDNACDAACNICGDSRLVPDHVYDNVCDNACNVCGITRRVSHNYVWVTDKFETCIEIGIKHEECVDCGFKRSENTPISATGHYYDNNNDMVCNNCGQYRETYYITFDLNDGTGFYEDLIKTEGISIALPTRQPVRSGYKFIGWSTTKNGTVKYSAGDEYLVDESTTLYAQWRKQCSFCSGNGINPHAAKCPDCSGSGTKTTECTRCSGSGTTGYKTTDTSCSACSASGTIEKYTTRICTSCSGSGGYRYCGICGTTLSAGQSKCWFCVAGVTKHAYCSTCSGKGSLKEFDGWGTCRACNGSGEVSKQVPINCTTCGGDGTCTNDCEHCEDGLIGKTCTACGGTGFDNNSPGTESNQPTVPSKPGTKPGGNALLNGDVDGDGKVTIKDATAIQKHVANLIVIDEEKFTCADTDKDGKITVKDATRIQKFLAALLPEL